MSPAPRARAAGLVLGMLLAASGAAAETRPAVLSLEAAPASAVYLQGSFFDACCQALDGIAVHVDGLLRAAGSARQLRIVPAVVNGGRIDWYDPMAFLRSRPAVPVALSRRPFDIAFLGDCDGCEGDPAAFRARLRQEAEVARRAGAEPVVFLPWTTRPEAQQRLTDITTRAANAAGAFVIPAGLAFARARALRPAIELTDEDARRPTLAGSYLAAAVGFAALYGRSPEGSAYRGGLDAETAAFLQRVAWEAAWDYFAGTAPPRS
jgi:hypothetical protein